MITWIIILASALVASLAVNAWLYQRSRKPIAREYTRTDYSRGLCTVQALGESGVRSFERRQVLQIDNQLAISCSREPEIPWGRWRDSDTLIAVNFNDGHFPWLCMIAGVSHDFVAQTDEIRLFALNFRNPYERTEAEDYLDRHLPGGLAVHGNARQEHDRLTETTTANPVDAIWAQGRLEMMES